MDFSFLDFIKNLVNAIRLPVVALPIPLFIADKKYFTTLLLGKSFIIVNHFKFILIRLII